MAYLPTNLIGCQPIAETSTTKNHALGQTVEAFDNTYGFGTFIYLAGVSSTAVGLAVVFDQYAGTTTLATTASRGPVAIAMSANTASRYGWYQIRGSAVVKTGTVEAGTQAYSTSTAGTLDDANVSGDQIDGCIFKTANGTPSSGYAVAQIDSPAMSGNGQLVIS